MIREDFAGAGGCSHGKMQAGIAEPTIGVEVNGLFASTATAAGYPRIVSDVREIRWVDWGTLVGYTAGPPCQTFSTTGARAGLPVLEALGDAVREVLDGALPEDLVEVEDERTLLTLEPALVIHRHRPEWILLEQVPGVQPVWDKYGAALSEVGYSVDTRVVRAERYGVPQSRRRAVLLASRTKAAVIPDGDDRVVTIGQAMAAAGIDWSSVDHIRSNYGTGGDAARRGIRRTDQLAMTMTGKANRNKVVMRDGSERSLTPREAGVLQGFPEDYPWQGSPSEQAQQVGNSVPPPLSAALLRAVV